MQGNQKGLIDKVLVGLQRRDVGARGSSQGGRKFQRRLDGILAPKESREHIRGLRTSDWKQERDCVQWSRCASTRLNVGVEHAQED